MKLLCTIFAAVAFLSLRASCPTPNIVIFLSGDISFLDTTPCGAADASRLAAAHARHHGFAEQRGGVISLSRGLPREVLPSSLARQMDEKVRYGIDNPHPLFNRKTGLVWDGKYDEYGRRREVDIAGCAMPLQKIEMIDEPLSRASAEWTMELFAKESRWLEDARNRLISGDNKLVMASLRAEFKGKVDLIYIDPPFDVARISRWTCRSATGRRPLPKTNQPWRWSPTATCGAKAPTPIGAKTLT